MAVSSSFQKLLLLIRRVRRLSGVALSGFPVHSCGPRCHFHQIRAGRIARNSRRGRLPGILCVCESTKTRLVRTWPNWPATNRRRPHPKGCPATTVVPPAVLLSSEADLWSCRTSYSLVLGGGAFAEPEGAAWPQQWSKRSKPKSQPANAASR